MLLTGRAMAASPALFNGGNRRRLWRLQIPSGAPSPTMDFLRKLILQGAQPHGTHRGALVKPDAANLHLRQSQFHSRREDLHEECAGGAVSGIRFSGWPSARLR